MSDAAQNRNSAAGSTPTSSRKRKVRRGTQSCWECKRRKVRCTFAAPTDTICDSCRSRRTKCVSQQFEDEARVNRRADRLSRMESLVDRLVKQGKADDRSGQDEVPDLVNVRGTNLESHATKGAPVTNIGLVGQEPECIEDISHSLLAVWPNQHDLDLISSIPVDVSILLHGIVRRPYSKIQSSQTELLRSMLKLPKEGSHPVLIARSLLMLGTYIQGISPDRAKSLVGLSMSCQTIMDRVIKAASRFVTSSDEIVASLEGLECIMIESMHQNNSGNLRRAWLTNRRAMAIAQMMRLHTGTGSSNMSLEIGTRDGIDPNYVWYRILCSDRYLSLLLGLPQGFLENTFASPEALASCTASERMECMVVVAVGLILERNSAQQTDYAMTRKIDDMLREAAALMPPKWWLTSAHPIDIPEDNEKAFEEIIRLTNQFAYHHLLVQLHLPYLMQPSSIDHCYDYSKLTAANASRAIVSQFVSFHGSRSTITYCRGIDFCTFVASITLCLAHIVSHRQHKFSTSGGETVLQSLQHQRLSDRGLLESTLEIMEAMASMHHDAIAKKISSILQPLLVIENDSASGACYHTSTSADADHQESQHLGKMDEASNTLSISIPHFGTVKIEQREMFSDADHLMHTLSEDGSQDALDSFLRPPPVPWDQNASAANTSGTQDPCPFIPSSAADTDDWALQGVDMALFSNLTQGSMMPTEPICDGP